MAERLAAEQATALKELELLQTNIVHIKDIVAMQQSYGKVSGVVEVVKVIDLVEDSLRMNAEALARHDVELRREYDARVPAIPVEKHKVLQILVNALTEKWRLLQQAKIKIDDLERIVNARTEALRKSEERFRNLCNFSPLGIFETDRDGHCCYQNPRLAGITGRSLEENLGDGWSQALHPADREATLALWQKAVAAGRE
ncbi:MAG: PAS domain S-box protein [Chloroflexi bacterium]|nr:PAS domain S-box protein [Chloroflexota bacterium]